MEAFSLFIKAEKAIPNWFELEPETLKEALHVSSLDLEKLFACQTVFHSHSAFTDYNIFDKVCSVFNDEPADFTYIQDHHPPEIVWTVVQMRMIDDVTPFSEEVMAYIAFHLHKDGIIYIPKEIENEKCLSNLLNIEYFLKEYNKNSAPLTKEAVVIQHKMLKKISEYVKIKQDNIAKETEHD